MTMRHAPWLVALLTAAPATGCFHEPTLAIEEAEQNPPLALEVRDPGGASFTPLAAPRDPMLALSFAHPAPADPEHALLLVRGQFEPALLARFQSARSSSVLQQRSRALSIERNGALLTVRPSSPLEPGASYSLAWLTSESALAFALQVSDSPTLGAHLVETWPGRGESQAPSTLARALLRLDGFVSGDVAAHVSLTSALGEAVPVSITREHCSARGLPEGDCLWLAPSRALVPASGYRLALGSGLLAGSGAPVAPAESVFDVVASEDPPPALLPQVCALDEQAVFSVCLRIEDRTLHVHGAVSEASLVSLSSGASALVAATLSYANLFALSLVLPADADAALLRLTDLSGQTEELELTWLPPVALAQVSIDEARADPRGKEPAQEYVELLNFGPTPVSLMGFTLSTDAHERGRGLLAAGATLAAGERALLVADDFDPRDASDGNLPGGIRLLSLDGALSLANTGGILFLRDTLGRRVSAAAVFAGLVEGQCTARRHLDDMQPSNLRSGDARLFELDPAGGCTPGSATSFGATAGP